MKMTILSMLRSQISRHQILNWDSVILLSPTQYQVLVHLLWQNNLREKKEEIIECYDFKVYSTTALKIYGGIDFKVSAEKDICVSRWLDNGVVTLASTFAVVEPIDQVRRWSESAKEHIMIDRPILLVYRTITWAEWIKLIILFLCTE